MNFTTNKNYKFDVISLPTESEEFKRVKEFFDDCRYNKKTLNKCTVQNFKIFKVIENNPVETLNKKRNNLMLFHGTKEGVVDMILENGFKNSKKGWYGKVIRFVVNLI